MLSFRNSSTHNGDAGTVAKDGSVEKVGVSSAKEVKPSGSTAGVGAVQKRSIGVYAQDHIRRTEDKNVVRM